MDELPPEPHTDPQLRVFREKTDARLRAGAEAFGELRDSTDTLSKSTKLLKAIAALLAASVPIFGVVLGKGQQSTESAAKATEAVARALESHIKEERQERHQDKLEEIRRFGLLQEAIVTRRRQPALAKSLDGGEE